MQTIDGQEAKVAQEAWGSGCCHPLLPRMFFFFFKGIHCVSISDPPDPKQDAAGRTSEAPDAALCENRLRVRLPLPRAQVQSCDNMRGQQD